jgi:chromosome segregation ATPase
MLAQLNKVKDD